MRSTWLWLRPAGMILAGVAPFLLLVCLTGCHAGLAASHPLSDTPRGGGSGLLAFTSYREDISQICLVNVDGSGLTQLTSEPNRLSRPVWSPDGSRIAFVQTEPGGADQDIMVMNADGSSLEQLSDSDAVDSDPAWSPDGTKLAFTSNRDSHIAYTNSRYTQVDIFEIYVMNSDGSEPVRLTSNQHWDVAPTWSPDGHWIAFQSNRDGNTEIYVMSSDGGGQRNLTKHGADDASPAWSPDGTRIAFHSDRDAASDFEIYTMAADGTDQTRLTTHDGWDINAAWSPDGQHLAFYRDLGRNFEVYLIRADGAGPFRLTDHPDFDGFASWQPREPRKP